jgi:hypothetical protein
VGGAGGITSPPPGFGTIGGTFGPIAGPVDIPPTFGPIASRPYREGYDQRRLTMPFNLGAILGASRYFLPQAPQAPRGYDPCAVPYSLDCFFSKITTPLPGRTTVMQSPGVANVSVTPGGALMRGCAPCYVSRPVKATTRQVRGRYCMGPDGQVVCIPRRRRMNFTNARAATRAATRLRGTMKFMKRIEKSIARACRKGGGGRSRARSCRTGRCK